MAGLSAGLAVGLAVAGPASAAPVHSAARAGGYLSVHPTRVLDTRHGTYGNRRGALHAGGATTVRVTGKDGVPTSAAAVVVSVSVVAATRSGVVTASTAGVEHRPGVATVSFHAGQRVSDLAIVRVTHGRITLWNASRGTVQLTADVSGYYVGGHSTDRASFHAVPGARVFDTRTGVHHTHRGAVHAGHAIAAQIGGVAGVPSDASAVVVTVTAFGAKKYGTVSAYTRGGDGLGSPVLQVQPHRASSQLVVLPLSPSRRITLVNHASDAVDLAVDVSGYYAGGPAENAYTTQSVEAGSGKALRQGAAIGGGRTRTVALGGVPRTGTTTAIVLVRVVHAAAAGSVTGSGGRAPTVVQFTADSTRGGVAFARVTDGRKITLTNTSKRVAHVQVDLLGYVTSTDTETARLNSTGRYLNDLTGSSTHDTAAMSAHGTADQQTDARVVLLDVGAQSITAPLTAADPGVVPALTASRVTIPYSELVDDVEAYLDAFDSASGGTPTTVVVATNTSGAFDPAGKNYYTPHARGVAWADDVIDPLRAAAPAGITVLGADDIEAGFGNRDPQTHLRDGATAAQALAWEDAYLAATSSALVYIGDAEGCPRTPGYTGRTCTPGWTQADYYRLAYNGGQVEVLPQVFYPYEAVKWADIDLGGTAHSAGGHLNFLGSLTDHHADPAHLSSPRSRAALYRALSVLQTDPRLDVAVDIGPA